MPRVLNDDFDPRDLNAPFAVARPLADRALDPEAARHDLLEPCGEAIARVLRLRDMHEFPWDVQIDGRQDRSELSYWSLGGWPGGHVCVWPPRPRWRLRMAARRSVWLQVGA